MKKKQTALIIVLLMISLCGCKNKDITTSGANRNKILFVVADLSDHFINTIAEQAEGYAKSNNLQLTVLDSENDAETQVSQIKDAREEGYGAIICLPVNADTSLQLTESADGLPVVFVNRCPNIDLLEKGKYIYVGSDNTIAGQYQAEFLSNQLKGNKVVKAVLFQGDKGQAATEERTEAVKEGLNQAGFSVEYVFEDSANWNREKAKELFKTFLRQDESFDCVISNNDEMALGVIEACKEEKIDPTTFPIVGIDATDDGCEAIQEGTMAFTVRQSAEGQGKYSVMAADRLMQGNNLKDIEFVTDDELYIWVPFEKVDISSLNS